MTAKAPSAPRQPPSQAGPTLAFSHAMASSAAGEPIVKQQDDYWYLTGVKINAASTADEARQLAAGLLPFVNGMGRAHNSSYRPVGLASSVINENTPQTRHVFVEAHMEGRGRLTIGGVSTPTAAALSSKAHANPALMEAVARLGASPDLSWDDLYKIFEVLRDDAGGGDALRRRVALSKTEVARFTQSANHPQASGDLARHARMSQQPPADPLTLEEGRQFIRDLITRW